MLIYCLLLIPQVGHSPPFGDVATLQPEPMGPWNTIGLRGAWVSSPAPLLAQSHLSSLNLSLLIC